MIGLAAMMCLIAPAFVSCDSDNDDDIKNVEAVTGTYSGTMTASVSMQGNVYENLEMPGTFEVKIIKQNSPSDEVTVILPECSYTPPMSDRIETIPALTIPNVDVEHESNGLYSLDKDKYTLAVDGVQYEVTIYDYDKDDKHREDGTTISGKNIRLVYSIVPGKMGAMGGSIDFTFSGTMK